MSYWEQFAKMFGLELDEEFSLAKSNGEKINKDTYKVMTDGLFLQITVWNKLVQRTLKNNLLSVNGRL